MAHIWNGSDGELEHILAVHEDIFELSFRHVCHVSNALGVVPSHRCQQVFPARAVRVHIEAEHAGWPVRSLTRYGQRYVRAWPEPASEIALKV